ncbi:unnamed protein product [Linum tenue]|uniref:Uncharacterized protein n=2 Tax=Linum tenue TaxID=586396 RepID=A0AAV0KZ00_9ROSI|nr:unnamed protein product [Linum tenue]
MRGSLTQLLSVQTLKRGSCLEGQNLEAWTGHNTSKEISIFMLRFSLLSLGAYLLNNTF